MQSDVLFPLTLALSLREREPIGARLGILTEQRTLPSAANVLPLLWGEGRGEGEWRCPLNCCGLEPMHQLVHEERAFAHRLLAEGAEPLGDLAEAGDELLLITTFHQAEILLEGLDVVLQ